MSERQRCVRCRNLFHVEFLFASHCVGCIPYCGVQWKGLTWFVNTFRHTLQAKFSMFRPPRLSEWCPKMVCAAVEVMVDRLNVGPVAARYGLDARAVRRLVRRVPTEEETRLSMWVNALRRYAPLEQRNAM